MIYFLRHVETGLIKIGKTKGFVSRIDQLKRKYGDIELLGLMSGYNEKESELHLTFTESNHRATLGGKEWFTPSNELLEYIRLNTSLELSERDLSLSARITVSDEVHEIYKDMTQGSGVTFDDILLYFAEQSGAELNKREKNFSLGIHMRESFAEWKAQKKKGKQ